MMKEYYPQLYAKVKTMLTWALKVSGSSVDEGEVNISPSESLIRQVLTGIIFPLRIPKKAWITCCRIAWVL